MSKLQLLEEEEKEEEIQKVISALSGIDDAHQIAESEEQLTVLLGCYWKWLVYLQTNFKKCHIEQNK